MLKKIVSVALTLGQVSQLLMVTPAFSAIETPNEVKTPEFNLIESTIALEGAGLSLEQAQANEIAIMKQYNATANKDGAEQRFGDALVQLGLYTRAQSDDFVAKIDSASQRLVAQNITTDDAANRAITQEVGLIFSKNASGAQFSGCTVASIATIVLGVGGGLALLGAAVDGIQALNNHGYSNSGWDTSTDTAYMAIAGAGALAISIGTIYLFSHNHVCSK